jgi:hypothetical protein
VSSSSIGILSFAKPIYCAREVLGSRTPVTIGDVPAILAIPSLPEWAEDEKDPLGNALIAPQSAQGLKRGSVELHWGMPQAFPSGLSLVEKAVVEFPLPPELNDDSSEKLHRSCTRWTQTFESYVALLTKNYASGLEVENIEESRLELLELCQGEVTHIPDPKNISLLVHVDQNHEGLLFEQLLEAAELASKQLLPRLQYRMLLESYRAMKEGDWRKTVIEAACAIEVSMTDRLEVELVKSGFDNGPWLMDHFRTLGRLYDLSEIVGIYFPSIDFKKEIVEVRNRMVHTACFPERKDAYQFLKKAEMIIEKLTPVLSQIWTHQ